MEYYNGFVFYLDENNSKWKEYYNNLGKKTFGVYSVAQYFTKKLKELADDKLDKVFNIESSYINQLSDNSLHLSEKAISNWKDIYSDLLQQGDVCVIAIPGYLWKGTPQTSYSFMTKVARKEVTLSDVLTIPEYAELVEKLFILRFGKKPQDCTTDTVEFFIPALQCAISEHFVASDSEDKTQTKKENTLQAPAQPVVNETVVEGYFYVKNTGEYAGKNGKSEDCYVLNEGVSVSKDLENTDYKISQVKKLSFKHDEFRNQAATIYGESTAYKFGKSDKSANDEIFAIAEVFKVNKKAYGATSTQAKEFLKGTDKDNKAWESRKAAYAAIIYTDLTANPTKYSNGATHWDGREQAIYSTDKRGVSADGEFTDDKSKSKFELHMNTWGWYIKDEHYKEWKKNIGTAFKAPQKKKATYGMNKDKICALSTAVHNQTIFWKVKNGGYKDEELK